MALTKATTEAVWLRRLLYQIGQPQKITVLFCDNQSSISMTTSTKHQDRTKHIDIQYHYVREQVLQETITIVHISTEDMTADIFTKGLAKRLHEKHTSFLGLVSEFPN